MIKNRLFFLNYSFAEIVVNLLCIFIFSFFLEGLSFYCLLTVNLFFILINIYLMRWSVNNNIYDSDVLAFYKFNYSCFSLILQTVFSVLQIIICYVLLDSLCKFTISLANWGTDSQFTNGQILIQIFMILFFGFQLLICMLAIVSRVLSKTRGNYTNTCNNFIKSLNLDVNKTFFCLSNENISGFISSGLSFDVNHGLIYNDFTFKYSEIQNYLTMMNLSFSELTDEHLNLMRMYYV